MSSYLSIIATIGLSGTITEIETCNIFVTMDIFLKDVFRPFFCRNISFLRFASLEIASRIILAFT